MSTVHFFVAGKPVPQGSLSAFVSHTTKRIISPQKPALVAWRKLVAAAAKSAIRNYSVAQLEMGGPKAVTLEFILQSPKKPRHEEPTTKPDLDKLTRGVLDALTGVLYNDDSQVVEIHCSKEYTGVEATTPGVWIKSS